MKLSFIAGRHRIDCSWNSFGFERYRVDGKKALRAWGLGRRATRSFAAGEGEDRRQVTIELEGSGRVVTVRAYVDGALAAQERRRWPLTGLDLVFIAAIIYILAAVLIPADHGAPRYLILNAHSAVKDFDGSLAPNILSYRQQTRRWPARNSELGLPEEGITFSDPERHVFHVQGDGSVLLRVFTQCFPGETHCKPGERYEFGQLSFRPAVDGAGDVRFVCGREAAPSGYKVIGADRSTMRGSDVPGRCR